MARGAFWTIIVDDQPTAFRAPVREDLLPTLKQLQRQHPNAVIKWFQRGRLWETPGDAMDASKPPRRGAGWRPGGEHKDPREAYKVPRDVKRARWASQAADGRGPWVKGKDRAPDGNAERRTPNAERGERPAWKPKGDRAPGTGFRAPEERGDRPAFKPREDRAAWKPKGEGRGTGSGSRGAGSGERRAWKPKGDRPAGERPAWKPKGDRPTGDRAEWKPKSDRPAFKPRGDRPAGDRPTGDPFDSAQGKRPAWKPSGPGIRRGAGTGAPRADWRERGPRGDATPRAGGDAPKPAAKRGKTWRVGELPPADRKKKKTED